VRRVGAAWRSESAFHPENLIQKANIAPKFAPKCRWPVIIASDA
jgi:hypothetical protein